MMHQPVKKPARETEMPVRRKTTKKTPAKSAGETTTVVMMRLFIAGSAPNSALAIANLEAICKRYLDGNYQLEIVDVFEQPQRALAEGVLVTPSFTKLSPGPEARVIGNLSDSKVVLAAIGLKEKKIK